MTSSEIEKMETDETPQSAPTAPKSVLPLFAQLGQVVPEKRVEAATELVTNIRTASESDVDYTITRLVKGLAANKGWSRPGFTMGLISLLKNCDIKIDTVLEKMATHLNDNVDVDNKKGLKLGRAFCLAAIIKSDQLKDVESGLKVMIELFKLIKEKEYLRQLVVELLLELIKNETIVNDAKVKKQLLDRVIGVGIEMTTDPDLALLLFTLKQKNIFELKQFKLIWGGETIITEKSFDKIKTIFASASNRHPHAHPVLGLVINEAMKLDDSKFSSFWSAVIENHLARQHWEKKYIAIDAISLGFEQLEERHVATFLQGETVRLIRNALSDFGNPSRDFLGKKAVTFCKAVTTRIQSADDKLQKMLLIALFKFFARTKPVCRAVLSGLSEKTEAWLLDWWCQFWVSGSDATFDLKIGEQRQSRKWLLDILATFINIKGEKGQWERALRTLIVSVLFAKPNKVSKKCQIDELKELVNQADFEEEDQFADIQNSIQNVINTDRAKYLKMSFTFATECLEQKHIQLRNPFEDVAQDIWNRFGGLTEKIEKHPYANVLEPLVAQCGFNMMLNAENHATVLNDLLNLVEDKDSKDDDWMPALVELLISLFVDENHKTRTLVLGCFRQISKNLNTASVQVIADAIDPEKDALLTAEEDEDDGVDSDEDEEDDRENEKMDSDSEESESDDEGIDTAPDTDLDELKKKLAAAMGQTEENSDSEEEEEEDWTDDQMFAVDKAIGAAFKSQGKAARDEKAKMDLQRRNFKLRVLDVVEIYLMRNSTSKDQFIFIMPLLKCSKVNAETPLSTKAGRILSKVMPDASKKAPCKDGDLDELIKLGRHLLYEMGQCQSSRYGDVLHQCFLFILKSHKLTNAPLDRLVGPIMKKLEAFMTKAKSKMSVKFFNDLAQRHPLYMIEALDRLADLSITAVNGYRKSVASDLMLKIVKSLPSEAKPKLSDGLLKASFDRAVKLLDDKKIKRDSVIAVNSNLLRFALRVACNLDNDEKAELHAQISTLRGTIEIYQQKQELKSLSQLVLNELQKEGESSGMDVARNKDAERQARRDQKRAKKAEKEAKFLKRMEEKKSSGEWVEKTKWKAMERKAAAAKKVSNVVDSDDDNDEETKKPKRNRQRQQKKKKTPNENNKPPVAKKARIEA